jgi:hypothetical protein
MRVTMLVTNVQVSDSIPMHHISAYTNHMIRVSQLKTDHLIDTTLQEKALDSDAQAQWQKWVDKINI